MINRGVLSISSLLCLAMMHGCVRSAHAQLRILDYNVAASSSSSSGPRPGMDTVLQAIGDQNRSGFSRPVDIMLMQEGHSVTTTGQAYADLLNTLTSGTAYRPSTVDGASTGSGRPMVVYNSAAVVLIGEEALGTAGVSSQPRQTLRYQFRPVGYDASADFYVYNSHLKSDSDSTSRNRRLIETTVNRANADALGDGVNIIYVGDLNVYSGTEASFQKLLAAGNGQGFDPTGQVGAWSDNAAYKAFHTQSPATTAAYGGQITGGVDDRFDFQLVSNEWLDGRGLDFVSGSYWAFGNTATHTMSGAITTGDPAALQAFLPGYTLGQSTTVLTNLARVTDHLPVVADYQLPAKMTAGLAAVPPAVICGAAVAASLSVSNSAPVGVVQGADRLDYGYVGSGMFVGSGTGSDPALGSGNTHSIPLSTTSVGLLSGTVSVVATGPQTATPAFSQAVTMGVLDHATASFASATTLVSLDIDFGTLTQGTGAADRSFSIFNRAGSLGAAWTAKLDLDHVLASVPGGIFSTTLSAFTNLSSGSSRTYGLSMLTTTTGSFSGTYSLSLSDEDLLGATSQPLSLTVRGSVVSPGNVVLDVPTGSKTQAELGFAAITGTAAVTKIGGGTAILSGTNSFTGPLAITDGILQSDSIAGIGSSSLIEITSNATLDLSAIPGGYTVAHGQTLGGTGTVLGSVVFGRGSTLSPGMFAAATVAASVSPVLAVAPAIDEAASVAVPEPMGWTLVLAGLGCGTACLTRRSWRSRDRS